MFFPLVVSIVFAFFIAHCFVTVFEMTVDTIFICYCIDIEENGGEGNPYYMSDKLRKVMMQLEGQNNGSIQEEGDGSNMPMQPQLYPVQPDQPYYPEQNGYPGQQPNYQDPGFPPQPPYPGQQGPQQPYGQPGYPPAGDPNQQPPFYPQPQYPGQAPVHPSLGPDSVTPPQAFPSPYHGQQPAYPGQQPHYPDLQPHFQGQQPPYPGQNPYPSQPQFSDPPLSPHQHLGHVNYPQTQDGYPLQQRPGYPQQPQPF